MTDTMTCHDAVQGIVLYAYACAAAPALQDGVAFENMVRQVDSRTVGSSRRCCRDVRGWRRAMCWASAVLMVLASAQGSPTSCQGDDPPICKRDSHQDHVGHEHHQPFVPS
jgi:hypothetical protein